MAAMGTAKQLQGFKHQAGFLMVGMSIALLAAAILTIGAARTSLNTWKENIGAGLGNQLQTINQALASYISSNSDSLIAGPPIEIPLPGSGNVTNMYSPTVAELIALGFLNAAVKDTPTAGTAYVIHISLTPSNCTTRCVPSGYVYLQDPIYGPDGKAADIRLLSAAMNASPTNQIGFSLSDGVSPTTSTITGNGWSFTNPDPTQRPGILYATTTLEGPSSDGTTTQYWLKPASTSAALPLRSNTLGDGRYAIDTHKPHIWNGTGWVEAYSDLNRNVSIGSGSGRGGSNNVMTGVDAGFANTRGVSNVFTGSNAGHSNTTGGYNVFTGTNAGYSNTTDGYNVFTGMNAGYSNTTGVNNVFTGYQAGYFNTTSYFNVFTGSFAGFSNRTGWRNVFTGMDAGLNNTTASNNVFTGASAGTANTTGDNNVFTGTYAGLENTTGQNNVFTGFSAGRYNKTGSNNTIYGASAGLNGADFVNASAFGYGATAPSSNSVRMGNSSVNWIGGEVAWSNASDRRLKIDIQATQRGLDFVLKLRPVDYLLKESKKHQTGFIAQEVEDIDPNFPGVTKPVDDKDFYSLTYTDFIPSLVKSIQELEARTATVPQAEALLQTNVIRWMCAMLALLTALVVWLFCQNQVMRRKLDLL